MTTIIFVPTTPSVSVDGAIDAFIKGIASTQKSTQVLAPFDDVIDTKTLESALAIDNLDDLMERVYSYVNDAQDGEITLIKGLSVAKHYATLVNKKTANALGAKVILVSDTDSTTELAIYSQVFGGKEGRVIGAVAKTTSNSLWFPVVAEITADFAKSRLPTFSKKVLSPSAFRVELVKKAQIAKKRIVLPEGDEPRTVEAASICQSRGIAQCVLLANRENVEKVAKERGVTLPDDIEIIDPASLIDQYIAPMVERRKGKLDEEGAKSALQDTVVLGTMMLQMGGVDGLVSGAIHTTANTIRPAFQLIKTAPEYNLVSSVFFMLLPEQVVAYADCAVNPNPNAQELAEIAIQTAESAKAFGLDPKVAMISYSTGTSGAGADVDLVKEATEIVRRRKPDLAIDGPLQYDAATVPSVAKSKAPDSPVAGSANVFIFPSLSVGNALYKAVQRSAKVLSVGPMLQGLNKPVNDLSRGALVDDIVYTIALTAIQADMKQA